tara:strand:+ start:12416 stop:12910 length:495 start_codon:yes stop_codon:yes gene_type:complete
MSRIKLLILLLISNITVSCSSGYNEERIKLSLGYIEGEYDGLVLSNQLKSNLNNFGMFDKNSKYKIQANISHSQNLFITNIDNTSDRERVTSSAEISVFDNILKCKTYEFKETIDQFYVLASSDKFTSNKIAFDEIKYENTEYFVRKFINGLSQSALYCKAFKR